MTIIKKGIKSATTAVQSEQALDVSRDVTVTTHSAYMMPHILASRDMEGILTHEVLALESVSVGTTFLAFNGERWEKRLFLDNLNVVNYAVDRNSNFYFLSRPKYVGCIDKNGDMRWRIALEHDDIIMPMNYDQLRQNGIQGCLLFAHDRLILLVKTEDKKAGTTAARLRIMTPAGEILAIQEVERDESNGDQMYELTINDHIIEIKNGRLLYKYSLEGEFLGKYSIEAKIEQESNKLLKDVALISTIGNKIVQDDRGHYYLLSRKVFNDHDEPEVQRVIFTSAGEVLKNDIFPCKEEEFAEVLDVFYHHGRIYVLTEWFLNEQEGLIQSEHYAEDAWGEVDDDLEIPFEDIDVYDLLKTISTSKLMMTIITSK